MSRTRRKYKIESAWKMHRRLRPYGCEHGESPATSHEMSARSQHRQSQQRDRAAFARNRKKQGRAIGKQESQQEETP